ncbi:MAG: insulinase family protein [Anaerolineales bacterium]|nr:insulinase family protein [Anaerolineales bacterium]
MDNSIERRKLDNGLLVLLKEIHTAPIISQWMWYRVGSRNERPGITGISHWTEHMQFKGTPRFPAGVPDRLIAREGGSWNAFTYLDWTTYYERMPAEKIDLALVLEADRMQGSLFTEQDVEAERTVIISERQGSENEPLFRLGEAVQAAAFQAHPYRNDIIGTMADLQSIQRDQLYQHYRTHYTPGNAVLTVAGDFEGEAMFQRIQELYAQIPGGNVPAHNIPIEPPQMSEQQVTVEGPGETTYIQVAYHAPEASHPDFWPFVVLDSLLSGPSSLNMFGGGISNKTSRLYRALVEGELAVHVHGGIGATIDPHLYTIMFTLRPGRSPAQALQKVEEEIDRLRQQTPTPDELQRALKQARALFAYGSESITNQAFWPGFSEMIDTVDWFTHYLARLEQVTPADVQRVAQQYLSLQQRTLGIYQPTGEPESPTMEAGDEA